LGKNQNPVKMYEKLSQEQLINLLKRKNMSTEGSKEDMVNRLYGKEVKTAEIKIEKVFL
jgi:hypothetical protein